MTSETQTGAKKSGNSKLWIIFDLALLLLAGFIILSLIPNGPQEVKNMVASRQATPDSATPVPDVQISLPLSVFSDKGAFLEAGSRINLVSVGGDVQVTTEADVIDLGEEAVLLGLPPEAAKDFMTDETPVMMYFELTPTPSPTPESTPSPTPMLRVQLPLPLAAFADGGAFLKPDGLVSLVGIAGGKVQVTTEVRVVELVEGTRPAVLLDVDKAAAPTIQAYMAAGTPVFQYIPLTPVP